MSPSSQRPRRSGAVRGERGVAAVELAILLPVLLLMVGGITDLGRAFFTQVSLTNAARAGVKEAALISPDPGRVQAQAVNAAPSLNPALLATNIPAPTYCGGPGSEASVTATYPFDWLLLEPALSFFGLADELPPQLETTAVLRCN